MQSPLRTFARVLTTGMFVLVVSLLLLIASLLLHLELYSATHPGAITEIDHNSELERRVEQHLMMSVPALLAGTSWVFWRLSGKWFRSRESAMGQDEAG